MIVISAIRFVVVIIFATEMMISVKFYVNGCGGRNGSYLEDGADVTELFSHFAAIKQ